MSTPNINSITIQFSIGANKRPAIPACDALESLYGIARTVLLTLNYVAEGKIRQRDFLFDRYSLNLHPFGSAGLQTIIEASINNTSDAYVSAMDVSLFLPLLKTVIASALGEPFDDQIADAERTGLLNPGDLGALIDISEPSLRRAHRIIGNGVGTISIYSGEGFQIELNQRSKEYIGTNIAERKTYQNFFSVGSYNVNSRHGRLYDFAEKRTISFEMHADADRQTIETVMNALSSYALTRLGDELKTLIAIEYRRILSPDGRAKKFIVTKARDHTSRPLQTDLFD